MVEMGKWVELGGGGQWVEQANLHEEDRAEIVVVVQHRVVSELDQFIFLVRLGGPLGTLWLDHYRVHVSPVGHNILQSKADKETDDQITPDHILDNAAGSQPARVK
jgi:hypothetical protein